MKKLGVIDLQSRNHEKSSKAVCAIAMGHGIDGVFVHVFSGSPKGYIFEGTIDLQSPFNAGEFSHLFLSIPIKLLNFRILKFPFSDRTKIRKVLPAELSNLILDEADAVTFDFVVLGAADNTFDVLVAFVRKDVLRDILSSLDSLQIEPEIVTSLELQSYVRNGMPDLISLLSNAEREHSIDRVRAAQEELVSPTINLRTGEFAFRKNFEKLWRTLRVTAVLLIILALLVNSEIAVSTIISKKESRIIKEEMRKTYVSLFPSEKKIADELYQLKSHVKDVKDRGEALIGVHPLYFLKALAQKQVQNVTFDEMTFNGEVVTVRAEALSMNDIDKAKGTLSALLNNIATSDIKPMADGKILFTVVGKIGIR
ncbi:MAG: hypothetical protein ACLPX5_09605 [Dissulfurispiraceae bacterium]